MKYLALLLALLLPMMGTAAQDETPSVEASDCWMTLYTIEDGEEVECGYLIVPETRGDPDSPLIKLAYVVLYAAGDDPAPDPIIYLAGGPGGNAVADVEVWLDLPFLEDRDLILIDQRGTGYSEPSLNCPEIENGDWNGIIACRNRLTDDGVNLSSYNSAESAADIADLAAALDYDDYNLYGISYGTRLALTVMRDHPANIRSAVIDSVYPPEARSWEEYGKNIAAVFKTLFAGCAADRVCNKAYPNLETLFWETTARLNDEPADYRRTDPATGRERDAELTGNDLINRIFVLLYDSESIPYLPYVIHQVTEGNYATLDELENRELFGWSFPQQKDHEDIRNSEGMYNSVECREEIPFLDFDQALANVPREPRPLYENSRLTIRVFFSRCDVWDVPPADDIESQPVASDIPTLVAAGKYDPITPVVWARSAARHLSNSTLIVVASGGHGVLESTYCTLGILTDFFDDPLAPLDTDCVADIDYPDWVTE